METRDAILRLLKERATTGAEIARRLDITRQAAHHHLKELVREGRVVKEGRTRGAAFRLASQAFPAPQKRRYGVRHRLVNLEEDRVFRDVALYLNLERQLSQDARAIAHYAFTEMLNNAIEHSRSRECRVEAELGTYEFRFLVRDFGIGVFASIATKYGLKGEEDAVGELIKGKTTTMPERHSGEGLFFTSKAADFLALRSHGLELVFENRKGDVFISRKRQVRGTEVRFALGRHSRRKLHAVFAAYAPGEFDYQFQRTRVLVKLFRNAYVSRSEARRLLAGLDKFREVILDFRGVKSLGQGFADEVFRVFPAAHPHVEIKTVNLEPALVVMIRHVLDESK